MLLSYKNELSGELKLVQEIKWNGKTQEYVFQINKYQLSDYIKWFGGIYPDRFFEYIEDLTDYDDRKDHPANDVYIIRNGSTDCRTGIIRLERDADLIQVRQYRGFTYYCERRSGTSEVEWEDFLQASDAFDFIYCGYPASFIDGKGNEIELEYIIKLMDKYYKLSDMTKEEQFIKNYYSYDEEVENLMKKFEKKGA